MMNEIVSGKTSFSPLIITKVMNYPTEYQELHYSQRYKKTNPAG